MSSNRNLVLAGAVLATATGAFIAGRMSAPGGTSADSASAAGQPSGKSALRTGAELSGNAAGTGRRGGGGTRGDAEAGTARGEEALARMEAMMRITDPMERNKAWMDFINAIDPAEFESVVAAFRGMGITNSRMTEYSMLLSAWAKKDPLQALAYAEANTGNRFARNSILTTWAAYDPDGAIRWAQEHHDPDDDEGNPWMIGVIQGIAAHDPERATQLLKGMNYSDERGEALNAMLPNILAQGNEAARAWAEAIEDEQLKQGAIGQIAEALAAKDPAGTAEWLAQNPGQAAQRRMDDVISAWMEKDPAAATAYYKNLPAGEVRTNALRGVATSMAMQDPRAAADFLDEHASDANDNVYRQFAWVSFGEAPDLAVSYIGKIGNAREQERMYDRMFRGWLRRDPGAATDWANSATLPQNVQERVQRRIQQMQQQQQ